jgi:parvulin-like peptidyl-prolyl isomerase
VPRALRHLQAVIVTVVVLAAALASAQAPPRPSGAAPAAPPASPPVARVGTRAIPRAELDARVQQAMDDYRAKRGAEVPADLRDLLRRQVLEGLIHSTMLTLEARRTGTLGSVDEAESLLKQVSFFSPGGRFDNSRWLAVRTTQPQQMSEAVMHMREQVGAQKLARGLEDRLAPPAAGARAEAERLLTRATVDALELPLADFTGSPEPREADVLAWYRDHAADYVQQDRATLTIAFVNDPPLADSLKGRADAVRLWTAAMKARAESVLASARNGVPFDSAASGLGFRSNVVVARDNFPGYWRGSAEQSAQLFRPEMTGRLLADPVPAAEGWLVVRVDDVTPMHRQPLREVSRSIRTLLRRDLRRNRESVERHALYAELRDSLAAPGWPIRYACVDTARLAVTAPSDADLRRFYLAHQADYASFDSRSGAIVTRSYEDVKPELYGRYDSENRRDEARRLAETLHDAWRAGKSVPSLETRFGARTTSPVVFGARVDTGLAGRALSDTIWRNPAPRGGTLFPYERGWVVWNALPRVEHVIPTYEQVEDQVGRRLEARREAEEEAGARAMYDADPAQFRGADRIWYTRMTVAPPSVLDVPLTRPEVEKWYHDNIAKYSAPELVGARHILVRPTDGSAAADRAAREKAEGILRRVLAGEDFTQLARAYSDDPGTREIGGDLGSFARGTMLEPFEKVVFTLEPGTVSPTLVKTELGYHIVKVTSHEPPVIQPLSLIYSAVSADAALEKANRMAQVTADSLYRHASTPRALVASATRAKAIVESVDIGLGDTFGSTISPEFFTALRAARPGQLVKGAFSVRGMGSWLAVVDSIVPARLPTWDEARLRARGRYRSEAGLRALHTKQAELDSMLAGGVTFDSLAQAWGGLTHLAELGPERGLPGVGNSAGLDSLVFGGPQGGAPAPVGQLSGWLVLPSGSARVRVDRRMVPSPPQVEARVAEIRALALREKLDAYFEELGRRYPVTILDRKLRETSLFSGGPKN